MKKLFGKIGAETWNSSATAWGDTTTTKGIVTNEKTDLTKVIGSSEYWEWLISEIPDTYNKGTFDVYNTTTQKLIAKSVDHTYLSEKNSDEFPIGIKKAFKDQYDSSKDETKRYYIDADGKVLKEYARPMHGFTKNGIAIITDEDDFHKRKFIDVNCKVMSVDWVSTFDDIRSSMRNTDTIIYLVRINDKRFLLTAHLEKLFDTAFSDKDKVEIIYKAAIKDWPLERFIAIQKAWEAVTFYDLYGNKITNEEDNEKLRYIWRNFSPENTNFEQQ